MDQTPEPEAPPLPWTVNVAEIEDGADRHLAASKAEMAEIADLLDLVALEGLVLDYRMRRGAGGRVRLEGKLKAKVTQTCVVSLEPVEADVDVPLDIAFWPAHLVEDFARKAEDPGQSGLLDWPEPITDGTIELGGIAYETLATALDPYPKKPGASFEWSQAGEAAEAGESGPFAALKQLKDR